jgi:hypothetical protein
MPTRLLDLGCLPERQDVIHTGNDWRELFNCRSCKLVEPSAESLGQYVALSYCWGKGLPYTTTTKNLQAHMQERGIGFAQLPRTLQDAAFLVRYLGLRYLWADCLCIVQDDKADWEHEAARMADVYSNAYLTIAAMRASHCDEGFLQPREAKDRAPITFIDSEGSFTLYFEYNDDTMSPGAPASVADGFPLRYERASSELQSENLHRRG